MRAAAGYVSRGFDPVDVPYAIECVAEAARAAAKAAATARATAARADSAACAEAAAAAASAAAAAARATVFTAITRLAVFAAVHADAGWLEGHKGEHFRSGRLIDQPLWLDSKTAQSASVRLTALARRTFSKHGFAPWIAWYDALLPTDPTVTPSDYFGEALTVRIASQPGEWWDRPAKQVSADIARWLEERDTATAPDAPALATAIAALPKSTPAPVNFLWRADVLEALSPDTVGDTAGLAQDYLDEARDQALHTQTRIGGNADPSVIRVVARVVDALPERLEAVRPAILDARCVALGVFLARYDAIPRGERELSEEALGDLETLVRMLQKLCAMLPDLAREAVESMAKDLEGKEETARPALVAIVQVASAAPITGATARPVLEALSEEISRPPDEPERRRWLAIAGTSIRDWLLEAGRFARRPVDAVTRELKALATEAYAKARPKLVDRAADAMVTGATAGVVGGVAWVMKAIVGDLEVIAKAVKGFDEILRLAREVMKFFKGKDPP